MPGLSWLRCFLIAGATALLVGCEAVPVVPTPSTLSTTGSNQEAGTIATVEGSPADRINGVVLDENGPIAGAIVRQQATENWTQTDDLGRFLLAGLPLDKSYVITAWADGYFVGWVEDPFTYAQPLEITLHRYYGYDNPDYGWFSLEGQEGSISCAHCMPCYEEWEDDAHAQSAVNLRFLTMYNGTDIHSNQSPLTRRISTREYASFPLPPDPTQPYYGPGYKLDFPTSAGNCGACHIPAQAAHPGMGYGADPNRAQGIEREGVFCEFCHKIGEVILDPNSGLPYPNMPGVLSMRLYRPQGEDQLFFGSFDDVTRRVSYLPLEQDSAFCAPCHYGIFWDQVIYNSFGEWLDSPYSDPQAERTCQDCHMPPVDYDYFVYPAKGGLLRDRSRILSHRMLGARDVEFLREGLSIQASAWRKDQDVRVEILLVNDNTGHAFPTDSPLRQLLLVVEAKDAEGRDLALISGPVLPGWAGERQPAQGHYAGLAGKGFALILEELWTGISPSGAYWNPVRVREDTRLRPFIPDLSYYTFTEGQGKTVRITIRLFFRRAFIELMEQKGWDDPDLLLFEQQIDLP